MTLSPNLTGILLMVLGMAGLAVTDALLKLLGGAIPIGQLMMIQGGAGFVIFGFLGWRNGDHDWVRKFVTPVVIWRNLFEVVAAVSFLSALVLVPLSTLSAILQANPLMVTLGAAIWLNEPVGPRRWAAIGVGFCGVLLVIQPWTDTVGSMALVCVLATAALSARDLATRSLPASVSTYQAATFGVISMVPVGGLLLWVSGDAAVWPSAAQSGLLAITILSMPIGYYGVTAAMRIGEVAVVTPFRYARIVFALILATLIFGERPNALTLLGAAIIVASGLYTLWRENVRRGA